MSLNARVRERLTASSLRRLRAANASDWRDFKAHWPMVLGRMFLGVVGGVFVGLVLGSMLLVDYLAQCLGGGL